MPNAQLDLPYFAIQDEDDILENVAQKFHRIFTRNDHFKVGCALCILLCDNLLTRTQVRPRRLLRGWRCHYSRCSF